MCVCVRLPAQHCPSLQAPRGTVQDVWPGGSGRKTQTLDTHSSQSPDRPQSLLAAVKTEYDVNKLKTRATRGHNNEGGVSNSHQGQEIKRSDNLFSVKHILNQYLRSQQTDDYPLDCDL